MCEIISDQTKKTDKLTVPKATKWKIDKKNK